MVGFKNFTFCWSVHAGWVDGDILKGCFKCHVLCVDPKRILWCPIVWVSWMGPGRGSWWCTWWSGGAVRERCVCRASQCVLVVVWASIFAASTNKGVVPAWRANGSMLLLSLSHRYMSPLWWLFTYLFKLKYGINDSILTTDASCPLFKCPYWFLMLVCHQNHQVCKLHWAASSTPSDKH